VRFLGQHQFLPRENGGRNVALRSVIASLRCRERGLRSAIRSRMLAQRRNTARLETWTKESNVYASVWV